MKYPEDRAYADRFIPHMQTILAPHVVKVAPLKVDQQQCGDLAVLTATPITIGCRIRRHEFLARYDNQFTLRYRRTNGMETEYDKIKNGWGNWILYGFAQNTEEPRVGKWWLISLKRFRAALIDGTVKPQVIPNRDGTTEFAWFPIKQEWLIGYGIEQEQPAVRINGYNQSTFL